MSTDTIEIIRDQVQALQKQKVAAERRVEKAKASLDEINRKLSAFEIVLKEVWSEEMPEPKAESIGSSRRSFNSRSGSLTGSVRDALGNVQSGRFDIEDIMAHIDTDSGITPKQATKTTGRLIREGDGSLELNGAVIRVVMQGAGSKSAIYEKIIPGEDEPGQIATQGGAGHDTDVPEFSPPDW